LHWTAQDVQMLDVPGSIFVSVTNLSLLYNIFITILRIIHPPVFNLKYNVSETGFCFRLQVVPILLDYFCRCSETETSFIYWANTNRFHLKNEDRSQTQKCCFK
jgi:hypothetical protein